MNNTRNIFFYFWEDANRCLSIRYPAPQAPRKGVPLTMVSCAKAPWERFFPCPCPVWNVASPDPHQRSLPHCCRCRSSVVGDCFSDGRRRPFSTSERQPGLNWSRKSSRVLFCRSTRKVFAQTAARPKAPAAAPTFYEKESLFMSCLGLASPGAFCHNASHQHGHLPFLSSDRGAYSLGYPFLQCHDLCARIGALSGRKMEGRLH